MREPESASRDGETEAGARLAALRREIQVGLDAAGRGNVVDGEDAFARVLDRISRVEAGECDG